MSDKNQRRRVAGMMLSMGTLFCSMAHAEEQTLAQKASDPTASLMSFQLSDWYTPSYHQADGSDNQTIFRAAIPYKIGLRKNIFRITLPYLTDQTIRSPLTNEKIVNSQGLSDTTIFNLTVFDQPSGRLGLGLVASLPTGGSRGSGQWGVGPAIGYVHQGKGTTYGLFNQNIFTVAGDKNRSKLNISQLQPLLSHQLGGGWGIGLSQMQITYDWNKSAWTRLPLGVGINKLQKFGKLPVRMSLEYEHNFVTKYVGQKDTVRFTTMFLFPTN